MFWALNRLFFQLTVVFIREADRYDALTRIVDALPSEIGVDNGAISGTLLYTINSTMSLPEDLTISVPEWNKFFTVVGSNEIRLNMANMDRSTDEGPLCADLIAIWAMHEELQASRKICLVKKADHLGRKASFIDDQRLVDDGRESSPVVINWPTQNSTVELREVSWSCWSM